MCRCDRLCSYSILSQAQQLVGSTLLAAEEDRPDLEEGEFYTRDLIGMRVILKVCTLMTIYYNHLQT